MRMRKILCVLLLTSAATLAAQEKSAADILRRSLDALGGESNLRSIHIVSFNAVAHRNAVEQSIRPEGPWFVIISRFSKRVIWIETNCVMTSNRVAITVSGGVMQSGTKLLSSSVKVSRHRLARTASSYPDAQRRCRTRGNRLHSALNGFSSTP